jgi:hypothetical protein
MARVDRMLKHPPRLRRPHSRPLPCQFPDPLRVGKGEVARQRSLQVGFQELDMPPFHQEEGHVDQAAALVALVGWSADMGGEGIWGRHGRVLPGLAEKSGPSVLNKTGPSPLTAEDSDQSPDEPVEALSAPRDCFVYRTDAGEDHDSSW